MSHLSITINGQNYPITCKDGQENRIRELAAGIDNKIQNLVSEMGQVGDSQLLVFAGLLVADELAELKEAAEEIDHLAERIEAIASHLEQS
jgi:cell division protein ZapA